MREKGEQRIDQVRNSIINSSLVIGSIVAVITYLISLTKFLESGFELSFVTDLIVIIAVLIITIKRKRLNVNLKSYVILLGIFIVVIIDVIEIGILSANKILLILIPFFSIISLSTRRALTYFFSTLGVIIIIAVLHVTETIPTPKEDTFGLAAWSINLLMIVLVAVIILLIVKSFDKAYNDFIQELKEKNETLNKNQQELARYKDDLEELVEQRTEELNKTNLALEGKTEELSGALVQLRQAQEELVQAEKNEALGNLATGVSHEINNPLNFIHGGLEIAELYLEEHLSKKQLSEIKPALDSIREGVERSSKVVKGLDQYSQLNSKHQQLSINEVLTDCLKILSNEIPKSIELSTNYSELPKIYSRKDGLYQIFLSIINNAIEAIDSRGKIKIITEQDKNLVLIRISDTGRGIPEANASKLGNPFFTTKKTSHGVGLGLYSSFQIIRKINGSIKIDSKEEEGTDVHIRLPIDA